MTEHEIDLLLEKQRAYYQSGATLNVDKRIDALRRLRAVIQKYQPEIAQALQADLGKSEYEAYMCEIGLSLTEISYMIRHTRRFAGKRWRYTPLAQFAATSYQLASPLGCTLIMSPWNYPFLLTIEPLADAVAAGNTCLVKPSAYSPHTSAIIEKIIRAVFPPEHVSVVTGGRKENSYLLHKRFDFIFFTGSQSVGREVLRSAAETLTPAVLELGGKSPCIVDDTANLALAARRIVFGKFLNCGQTCVAPDFILCDAAVKDTLVKEIISQIRLQFSDHPLQNPNYGKIINEKHFDRLLALIDENKLVHGGESNRETLQIAPAVLDNVTMDDPVMQEEIFGPILPILTYERFEDVIPLLSSREKPLALYLFSEDKQHIEQITHRLSYGGGCINDVVIHLATSEMPFGGVGESGMGAYHGKMGFDTFSHVKSIVNKKTFMDLPMRYQPYQNFYRKLLSFFLR
ncbi:MAG: aldehyde dehydrogenase [Clostridia bacterium]|nr:aldehyde dehydrogenase [Clostridia bacterium]